MEVGPRYAILDPLPLLLSPGGSGRVDLKGGAQSPDPRPCRRRHHEDPQPRRRGIRGTRDQGEQLTGLGGEGEWVRELGKGGAGPSRRGFAFKIKKIAGLGRGCSLSSLPTCQLWDCTDQVNAPRCWREDWQALPRSWGCACAKANPWPRRPRAPSPGNGPPPPSLETGAAVEAIGLVPAGGRLIWPACLQAFLREAVTPFELWGTHRLTLNPPPSNPQAGGVPRPPSGAVGKSISSSPASLRRCSRYPSMAWTCRAVKGSPRARPTCGAGHQGPA